MTKVNGHDIKDGGYAHQNTRPDSRVDDRRKRAAAIRERCLREHPQIDGRCAREVAK